jgi:hypothetical protein
MFMKKFKMGLMSLALVLGFAAAFASTAVKAHKTNTASLYWYPVNPSTNQTEGSAAYHDEKANVISAQPCDDTPARPICYFGSTTSNVPVGTNVGTPAASNRILEQQ